MVVNFRARGISRGTRKLTRTPIKYMFSIKLGLGKFNKKYFYLKILFLCF